MKRTYDPVIRELMQTIEVMRMACEHCDGRKASDRRRLTHAMSLGIKTNYKYRHLVPDYQRPTFWDEVHKL